MALKGTETPNTTPMCRCQNAILQETGMQQMETKSKLKTWLLLSIKAKGVLTGSITRRRILTLQACLRIESGRISSLEVLSSFGNIAGSVQSTLMMCLIIWHHEALYYRVYLYLFTPWAEQLESLAWQLPQTTKLSHPVGHMARHQTPSVIAEPFPYTSPRYVPILSGG